MLKEFKDFAIRGSVVDLAVGVIIGGAFGGIVTSLVNDVLMPPIGLVIGGIDFSNIFVVLKQGVKAAGPYPSLAAAKAAGAVTLNLGIFINTVINFVIIGWVIFMVVKGVNRLHRQEEKAAPGPTRQEVLLEEIRDLLKRP